MQRRRPELPALLSGLLIAAWFLYFAGDGLWAPFTYDDLMNLHAHLQKSWPALLTDNVRYWSTAYRPMGGLFYVGMYELFGFHPMPFRIVCFVLLALNLALLCRFAQQISRSAEVALFATFLVSYHAWFVDLYQGSGTIYDVLCFTFYFAAFTFYLRIRQDGQLPDWRQSLSITGLYICALNSKEMAVTLPVFLLIYEGIFHPPAFRSIFRWLRLECRTCIITSAVTVPYVVSKLTGAGSLIENPAYQVSISPGRFLDTFHLYLNPFLYQDHVFRDSNTVQMLIAMLVLALWLRLRSMAFSWFFLLLSVLPVSFIHHYSAFFLYLPSVGWAIYAGELLRLIRRGVSYALQTSGVTQKPVVATAIVMGVLASGLAVAHLRERPSTMRLFRSNQPPTREMAAMLIGLQPSLRKGGRLLFVNDPFPKEEYFLVFLVRLLYRDRTIQVVRTTLQTVPASQYVDFDAVFAFDEGRKLVRQSGLR